MSSALLLLMPGVAGVSGPALRQSSGLKEIASSAGTTFTFSMPAIFTAGSSVFIPCAAFGAANADAISGITVSGTAMTKEITRQDGGAPAYWTNIWRAHNVAGGNGTVVVTFFATGSYFSGSCEEFTALTNAASDVSASAAGTTNLTVTTGAKTQNSAVVIAVSTCGDVFTGGTTFSGPTTGFTQTALETTAGTYLGVAAGYKIVNAAGTEAASWSATPARSLSGCVAVFKA